MNPHLKPRWKPGQSGNPKGRPKKAKFIPDILAKIGREKIPPAILAVIQKAYPHKAAVLAKDERFLDALCRAVWIRALQGESWAVLFIAERTEGKVKDVVDVNENAVQLRIVEEVVRVGDNPPDKTP